jgi:hypothetical protein
MEIIASRSQSNTFAGGATPCNDKHNKLRDECGLLFKE